MNPLYEAMDVSVFERMSLAAARHGATNLGQGFPDFGWPPEILAEAQRALAEGSNQYAPSRGLPAQREAIAAHYGRHQGLDLSPDHICVTSGATEAIAASLLATVQTGDEVILFAPAYDAYAPLIRRAGGLPVEVRLEAPDFQLARDAIAAKISPKTRAIMLNNPHNPTGRLYGPEELEAVAGLAREHDLIIISDEVWEHLLLDGQNFTSIMALPDMAGRTIKCGSAGKIFSLTGWKIGWIVAAPEMASVVARAHQFLTFASAPNLQAAVAFGLGQDQWLEPMRQGFARARDRMLAGIEAGGFVPLNPASTYFMTVDLAASGIALDDESFARLAVEQAGVAVIPMSPFYIHDPATHLIRLCFAKQDATIDAGVAGLIKAKALATQA